MGSQELSLCSLSDLLLLKEIAHRGQDQADCDQLKVIQSLRSEGFSPEGLESAYPEFSKEHLRALSEFHALPASQKLDWLLEMLTHLGQFCVL